MRVHAVNRGACLKRTASTHCEENLRGATCEQDLEWSPGPSCVERAAWNEGVRAPWTKQHRRIQRRFARAQT
eukprot:6182928-Pleurochrysis_carterae.AAC.1